MERSERDKREARMWYRWKAATEKESAVTKKKVHPTDEPSAFWVKLPKGIGSFLWDI